MLGLLNIVLAAFLTPEKLALDPSNKNNFIERSVGVCELPLAIGNCSRDFPRYYYNADTALCYKFTYTGCGGNANRFISKLHCKQRCVKGWTSGRTKVTATFKDPSATSFCEGCEDKNGICVNGICQCKKGYELVKEKCVDTNECLWEKCPKNSICTNLPGTFRCECKLGWSGNGLNCSKSHEICSQPFDSRYETNCARFKDTGWTIRYYYNSRTDTCNKFWYGGCQYEESMNIFNELQSCESLCVRQTNRLRMILPSSTEFDGFRELSATTTETPFPVVCLDSFDERRRKPCVKSEWVHRYYFDNRSKSCQMFWYDQSCGLHQPFRSRNVFVHLSTCMRACEGVNPDIYGSHPNTTTLQPYHPHLHTHKKHHHHSTLPPDYHPSITVTPQKSLINPTPFLEPIAYPQSTLETLKPKVKPTSSVTKHKTVGVIQAMFTISKTSRRPLTENNIVEEVDKEEIHLDDLTNLIESSPNFNTIGIHGTDKSLSISTDCLVPFDKNLSTSCSNGQQPWRPRYYYDIKSKQCQLFWNDGCMSANKNNFEDLSTCKWMCEGANLRPDATHCLDEFDKSYTDNCRENKYEIRYFFNHQSKLCELFYHGGCRAKSKNIFENYRDCQDLCVSANKNTIESCSEPFDPVYRGSCDRKGAYAQYYYFDQKTQSCRMFWYGNCKGKGRNIFDKLENCQWLCEKKREQKIPANCMDRFDENYRKACNRGSWAKRWYFDQAGGECKSFWHDGCVGSSQNIFVEEMTCKSLCEMPALPTEATIEAISEETAREKEIYRCLEPKKIGDCQNRFPAYYYNKKDGRCEPFAYSGCNGNGNRFLTLSQCQSTCHRFNTVKADEMACYLPLSVGHGRQNKTCIREAGYKFYFNSKYGKCGRFWYFGCGKNQNNFATYDECEKLCRGNSVTKLLENPRPLSACFQQIDVGKCEEKPLAKNNVTRYGYVSEKKECKAFEYTGCKGNDNRFESETECKDFCGRLATPNSEKCVFLPDWGPCNQLNYMWYYNLSSGVCEQFLYGGCKGNANRFASFELCQVTCEIPSAGDTDICADKLDRGQWCEPMTNRYFYHQKSKSCKGFHYTGCGESRNNFKNVEDCEDVCIHRRRPTSLLSMASNVTSESIKTGSSIVKYVGTKPSERPQLEKHIILTEDAQRYVKSDGEWLDYKNCIGFRYNISGAFTRLKSYICLMEEGGTCQVETLNSTNGEEKCLKIKPWLRGEHFYTWFFTVQRRTWRWSPKARRRQSPQETTASLIILPGVQDCNALC